MLITGDACGIGHGVPTRLTNQSLRQSLPAPGRLQWKNNINSGARSIARSYYAAAYFNNAISWLRLLIPSLA